MTWKDFSHRVDRTPGRDIVLACKSSEIYKFIDNSAALGFTGIVEATLGGFLASNILLKSFEINYFINTIFKLFTGAIEVQFLDLTLLEFAWDTVNFMIGLMLSGAGLMITSAVIDCLLTIVGVLFIDVFLIAGAVAGGYYSWLDLILPLISLMLAIVIGLSTLFPHLSWLIAAQTAVLSTPCGYTLIALNIGVYIAQLVYDYLD
jgi:hypothetical protein